MQITTNQHNLKKLCESLKLDCDLIEDESTAPYLLISGNEVNDIAKLANSVQGRMILNLLPKR